MLCLLPEAILGHFASMLIILYELLLFFLIHRQRHANMLLNNYEYSHDQIIQRNVTPKFSDKLLTLEEEIDETLEDFKLFKKQFGVLGKGLIPRYRGF